VIVAAARFPAALQADPDWSGTTIGTPDQLPAGRWRNILTGEEVARTNAGFLAETVFRCLPVAVLVPDDNHQSPAFKPIAI
jgi:maltooligosyltrehalose synthase